jgi:hypothetical protein
VKVYWGQVRESVKDSDGLLAMTHTRVPKSRFPEQDSKNIPRKDEQQYLGVYSDLCN